MTALRQANFNNNRLNYDTRFINQNFRMVLSSTKDNSRKLIGITGLIDAIGWNNANISIVRAFRAGTDKFTVKRRNGLRIEFYAK